MQPCVFSYKLNDDTSRFTVKLCKIFFISPPALTVYTCAHLIIGVYMDVYLLYTSLLRPRADTLTCLLALIRQLRVARSLWTKRWLERYSIPRATCRHTDTWEETWDKINTLCVCFCMHRIKYFMKFMLTDTYNTSVHVTRFTFCLVLSGCTFTFSSLLLEIFRYCFRSPCERENRITYTCWGYVHTAW